MPSIPDLDLDEVEQRIRWVGNEGDIDIAHDLVTLTLPKLITELRACRKLRDQLVEFYVDCQTEGGPAWIGQRLATILSEYDHGR